MSDHKSHKVELDRDLRDLFDGSMSEDYIWCQTETNRRRSRRMTYMREVLGMTYNDIGRAANRSGSMVRISIERYKKNYPLNYVERYINPDVAAQNAALEIRDALRKRTGFNNGGDMSQEEVEEARDFVVKLRMKALMKALGNPRIHDKRDWIDLGD